MTWRLLLIVSASDWCSKIDWYLMQNLGGLLFWTTLYIYYHHGSPWLITLIHESLSVNNSHERRLYQRKLSAAGRTPAQDRLYWTSSSHLRSDENNCENADGVDDKQTDSATGRWHEAPFSERWQPAEWCIRSPQAPMPAMMDREKEEFVGTRKSASCIPDYCAAVI